MRDPAQGLSPLGAIAFGFLAGAIGSAAQSRFFRLSAKLSPALPPKPPEGAFEPPEPAQRDESALSTIARRFVEDLMRRGPLTSEQKRVGGEVVHYLFGGGWGALYGVLKTSLDGKPSKPVLALAFGTAVWVASDNLLLPAFKLSAWPNRYPPRNHFYAWVAHQVYGAVVWASFEALEALERRREKNHHPAHEVELAKQIDRLRAA